MAACVRVSHSRGLAADLSMVPLLAVGEVLLIGAFNLLHGTNVGPAGEHRLQIVHV